MDKQIKLGIIQPRGAGDIIITLPIAKWFYKKGIEVHWVIDQVHIKAFQYAAPYVKFHSISVNENEIKSNIRHPYWFETPRKILIENKCNEIISFPYEEILHYKQLKELADTRIIDPLPINSKICKIPFFTKFDQHRYVLCSVPFLEKWNLDIRRNYEREEKLYKQVTNNKPYALFNLIGGVQEHIKVNVNIPRFLKSINAENLNVIHISKLTDNLLDWITIIEKATIFVGVDSFYVNLIDQLKIDINKYFIRRSTTHHTPVLGTNWNILPIELEADNPHELRF